MNKTCARCQKVVYPIEELKCLDKTWHKTCFKCTECGMALNMKTYKGYNKMPYCEAHIPKAKATAIADTPELKRIAENTKIQSNVKYHADFEKAKGKFTQVADDPETLRIKQNTKHISNVAYHGDLEKKAAMEKQRGSAEVSDSSTTSQPQQQQQPPQQQQQPQAVNNYNQLRSAILHNSHHPSGNAVEQYDLQQQQQQLLQQQQQQPAAAIQQQHSHNSLLNNNASNGSIHSNNNNGGHAAHPASLSYPQQTRSQASVHSNNSHPSKHQLQQQQQQPSTGNLQQLYVASNYSTVTPSENALGNKLQASNGHLPVVVMNAQQQQQQQQSSNNIGKIADYDPLTDGPRNVPNAGRSSTTLVYSSDQRGSGGIGNSVYPKRIGSISDIDPANGIYGSLSSAEQAQAQKQHQLYQQMQMMQQQEQQQQQVRQQPSYEALQDKQSRQSTALRVYRAIYDYEAQDVDEVSFREGDVIFEVESIDSGWMTGRVERTGKTGMLPANYVEQAVI
ncbi:LIM and SH3 domain protein Lasp isoform X3 [Drosophila albomicans]|uniref:LIM and SH3 domain protein Lasp isoform X3 n=1 Tax=Drosophila albomicans TaxID=7291 RepID=A0A6P8WTR0_DROAB|nr:LIM and SH3 domain protein Lasp isoform X3 [Drosophila albomicans]